MRGIISLVIACGDILTTHWAIEDGHGRILTHRIRINFDEIGCSTTSQNIALGR